MEDRHAVAGLGARAIVAIGNAELQSAVFYNPIDDDDVRDAESGSSASLAIALPVNVGRFEVSPSLGYEWYSKEVVDFLYGVNTAEVSATRAAFNGKDAGVGFIGVEATGMLTDHLRLSGGVRYESLPDEISDSPLVDDEHTVRARIGLGWIF